MTRGSRNVPAKARLTPEEVALFDGINPASLRRLLLAALESFAEHGFRGTTTRDIARHAKMSNAAIYSHYQSKDELLFEISLAIHTVMLDDMRESFTRSSTARERLANVVRTLVTHHAHQQTAARVATYELRSLSPAHRASIAAIRRDMESIIREAIRAGADEGEFTVPDLGVATMAIVSLVVDVARWYNPARRLTPDELAEHYVVLVEGLVRARPARARGRAPERAEIPERIGVVSRPRARKAAAAG